MATERMPDLAATVAVELALPRAAVERTLALFAGGATIPFIARYRKEATGGLDEVMIGQIQERYGYHSELEARRKTVLDSIAVQGKLGDDLRARILATSSKTELEDLYLPYKPKRRTKATIARERGLEPLADLVWAQAIRLEQPREALARPFVDAAQGVPDVEAAWQGARDIVAERIAEDADVRASLRDLALADGRLASRVAKGKEQGGKKFEDYYAFEGPARTLPGHRVLAVFRGENEGFLKVSLAVDEEAALARIRRRVVRERRAALASDLDAAVADAWRRLLGPSIEADVRAALQERADADAIRVFAENLRHLLLQPPLGGKRVLAIDPGFRTGCKVVVLDEQGDLVEETVIYPHEPQRRAAEATQVLAALADRHRIEAVAVGNGTAGRETHELVRGMKREKRLAEACVVVLVNESGASVYSASAIAREELPDKDVTVRGAASIGRRLQDPLAELVKIDPKSIGVGQYQHDVNQPALKRSLDAVVESCVNKVGVDVNTASARLLSYVSGIGETLARNIVSFRAEHGPLRSRQALLKVPRLGPKAFEQAAGFLRIRGGDNPLDASGVHPEAYPVVERILAKTGTGIDKLIGDAATLRRLKVDDFVDERFGAPTVQDILTELEKPGRDPRPAFQTAEFREDVSTITDLREAMVLEGVVTNVANFGAFVDIGVHQDGLVHVSCLSREYVADPRAVVKVGQVVKVKVLSVDVPRKRIALTMRLDDAPG
ncbi:MAG TPA: Tex family protein, partial [Candidatus Limnocylindrales bacterium]|nr:Tex family protein [Candidatus Limnocylindrales bacterium]